MIAAMLAKTIKNVMEAQVIDERGAITYASRKVLEESETVMQQLRLT
jgi:hypothetical protein